MGLHRYVRDGLMDSKKLACVVQLEDPRWTMEDKAETIQTPLLTSVPNLNPIRSYSDWSRMCTDVQPVKDEPKKLLSCAVAC